MRDLSGPIASLISRRVDARLVRAGSRARLALLRRFPRAAAPGGGTLILTTRGRATGQPHATPLPFVERGGHLYVGAPSAGRGTAPDWYLDLIADPRAGLERGGDRTDCTARVPGPEEAERIRPLLDPAFRHRAGPRIPVVELVPADRPVPLVGSAPVPRSDAPGGDAPAGDGGPPALFSLREVGVRRGDRWILRAVTVDVPETGVTAVVGPSGAGKTSLLRLCNRLDAPDTGTVLHRGHDLAGLDVLRHRRRVGMVFQQPTVFGGTVRDNLRAARPDAADDRFRDVLRDVGLPPELLGAEAARLSGGEAQRVCLARTLITRPEVLLLDEPTSALDADNRLAFERLVLDLTGRRRAGQAPPVAAVLWVTHDEHQLHRVADHVICLDAGEVTYAGPPPGPGREARCEEARP